MSDCLIPWPKIRHFHDVLFNAIKGAEAKGEDPPQLLYRAKVKLDGTNAGVQVWPDGHIVAQSRGVVLKESHDNYNFRKWVFENEEYFSSLKRESAHITIFGEWCGQGIQKRTAISKIDRKVFAVFAVQTEGQIIVDPVDIWHCVVPRRSMPHYDIYIIPWALGYYSLNFANSSELQEGLERINQLVADIEQCDPWVKQAFGVDGLGEGVVMYPQSEAMTRDFFSDFVFKAKGEKHRTVCQEKPAQAEPATADIIHFAKLVATEPRLEQALTETCIDGVSLKNVGAFLKWVAMDVQKECARELGSKSRKL